MDKRGAKAERGYPGPMRGQYANRSYWYTELAVFSQLVAETIDRTHCPSHRGMASLSWPGLLINTEVVCPSVSQY